MNPFAILKLVTAAISVGKLFWNAGKVIRYFKTVGPIASHIVTQRRTPSACESKEFLHATGELIRSGIIDFPGVDEAAIADAIEAVDAEIECSVKAS